MAEKPQGQFFGPVEGSGQGPFAAWLDPQQAQARAKQQTQIPAPGGRISPFAAAAAIGTKFLEGMQAGRLTSYANEQQERAAQWQDLDRTAQNLMQTPGLNDAGRQYIQKTAMGFQGGKLAHEITEAQKGQPKDQPPGFGHHVANILKEIGLGAVGGKLPKGIDKINAGDVRSKMLGDLFTVDENGRQVLKPEFSQQAQSEAIGQKVQDSVKDAKNQTEAARAMAPHWNGMVQAMGEKGANDYWNSVVQGFEPAAAQGKDYKAEVTSRVEAWRSLHPGQEPDAAALDEISQAAGIIKRDKSVNLQAGWAHYPGEPPEKLHAVRIDPRQPGRVLDANSGKPVPSGAEQVNPAAVNAQMRQDTYGAFGNFYRSAKGRGMSDEQARQVAGEMVFQQYRVQLGRQEQNIAIDADLSGIQAPAVNLPGATPPVAGTPPAAQGAQQPQGAPPQPQGATSGTGTPAPPQQAAPPAGSAAPPVAKPASTAKPAESKPAAGLAALSDKDRSLVDGYLGTIFGTNPGTGGKAGAAGNKRGMETLAKTLGLTPVALQSSMVENKALAATLAQQMKSAFLYQRVQKALDLHGEVLKDAATKYNPGGVPLTNRSYQWFQENLGAHPELVRLNAAINAVLTEYSRIVSGGAQSNAMPRVAAMEKGNAVLKKDATMQDILAAVDQFRIEAEKTQESFEDTIDSIKGRINKNLGEGDDKKSDKPPAAKTPLDGWQASDPFQPGGAQGPGSGKPDSSKPDSGNSIGLKF